MFPVSIFSGLPAVASSLAPCEHICLSIHHPSHRSQNELLKLYPDFILLHWKSSESFPLCSEENPNSLCWFIEPREIWCLPTFLCQLIPISPCPLCSKNTDWHLLRFSNSPTFFCLNLCSLRYLESSWFYFSTSYHMTNFFLSTNIQMSPRYCYCPVLILYLALISLSQF